MPSLSKRRLLALSLLAAPLARAAFAQTWPDRPIRIVVPFPAGAGVLDIMARLLAQHLGPALGQQIVIDNRPGAGGTIGADVVAKAPPDGYTVLMGNPSLVVNPFLMAKMPYDPMTDFIPLTLVNTAPLLLVAHPSVPAKTLGELTAWVKANPGKVSYASFSPGTISHFLGYHLNEKFALDMTHITYKGSGPQVQALLGGHVPIGFSQIQTGLPHVQAGKLVPIAVSGATRWRQLPNVPTFAELGHGDFTATTWFGLVARAGTPAEVLARLIDTTRRAHTEPATREKLEQMGFDVAAQTGAEFAAAARAGQDRWAGVVKATGFKATN